MSVHCIKKTHGGDSVEMLGLLGGGPLSISGDMGDDSWFQKKLYPAIPLQWSSFRQQNRYLLSASGLIHMDMFGLPGVEIFHILVL